MTGIHKNFEGLVIQIKSNRMEFIQSKRKWTYSFCYMYILNDYCQNNIPINDPN